MTRHLSLITLLLFGSAGVLIRPAQAQQTETPAPAPAAEVPTMQQAGALLNAQDWQAAATAYAKIVTAQPENATAWQLLGYCLHAKGDLDRALRVHSHAATFAATRPIALYNVACVHALQGRPDQAFTALEQAIQAGFNDPNQYLNDSDLSSLHGDARWERVLAILNGEDVVVEVPAPEAVEAGAKRDAGEALALGALPPAQRFDFWVGDWDVWMNGQVVDTWKVRKELGGTAIRQTSEYAMTLVNFEPTTQKWHMTWINREGHHDILVGGLEGDNKLVLHQAVVREHPGAIGRWVMRDFHAKSFASDWQLSFDQGKTWKTDSTMTYWRSQGDGASATAAASQASDYNFLLGEFQVEFKAMLPDQSWTSGSGRCSASRSDDGTIVEKQSLQLEDGTSWEGTSKRHFDAADGGWNSVWTSADGATSVEADCQRKDGKLVEVSTGSDQYGAFRDVVSFTKLGDVGYSVWLDRTYTDSGRVIEGLYRATHRRVR